MLIKPWWKFIVLRGEGLPANMDGLWLDVQHLADRGPLNTFDRDSARFEATNQWEQRGDGEVAVVFRHFTR